jgi:hypothetical protein
VWLGRRSGTVGSTQKLEQAGGCGSRASLVDVTGAPRELVVDPPQRLILHVPNGADERREPCVVGAVLSSGRYQWKQSCLHSERAGRILW